MQPCRQRFELRLRAGRRQHGVADVIVEVDILVLDPHRVGQVKGHQRQLAREHRRQVHAFRQMQLDGFVPAAFETLGQLVAVQRADMHRHLGTFKVQECAVDGAQVLHLGHGVSSRSGLPPLYSALAARRPAGLLPLPALTPALSRKREREEYDPRMDRHDPTAASSAEARREYYQRIAPLWPDAAVGSSPRPGAAGPSSRSRLPTGTTAMCAPLLEAGGLITAEEAERRVLILENPACAASRRSPSAVCRAATDPARRDRAGAPPHAVGAAPRARGDGAFTAVDGERTTCAPATSSSRRPGPGTTTATRAAAVVWVDGLDIPLIRFLEAGFGRGTTTSGGRSRSRHPKAPRSARFGSGLLPLGEAPRPSARPRRFSVTPTSAAGPRWRALAAADAPRPPSRPHAALRQPAGRRLGDADDRDLADQPAPGLRDAAGRGAATRTVYVCLEGGGDARGSAPKVPRGRARHLRRAVVAGVLSLGRPRGQLSSSAFPTDRCSRCSACGASSASTERRCRRALPPRARCSSRVAASAAWPARWPWRARPPRRGLRAGAEIGEIGAGLQLGPNAFAALEALGVGEQSPAARLHRAHGDDGRGGLQRDRVDPGRRRTFARASAIPMRSSTAPTCSRGTACSRTARIRWSHPLGTRIASISASTARPRSAPRPAASPARHWSAATA